MERRQRALLLRLLRGFGFVLTLISLAAAALGTAAFWSGSYAQWLVVAASVSAGSLPAAVVGLLITAALRRWVVLAVAALLLLVTLVAQFPLLTSTSVPQGTSVTVMTANLRLGRASPAAIVAAVKRHDVTVLCVQELTPAERDRLRDAGLYKILPYTVTQPQDGASGTGLWSRWPLRDKTRGGLADLSQVRALMTVPGRSQPATVSAIHLSAPFPESAANWRRSVAALHTALSGTPSGPLIVAGDFNSSYGNRQFRGLLRGGLRDAAEQAGAGWTRTFPSNRWFTALVGIDHVLSRGATAEHVSTLQIDGSDHRAVLAQLVLP